MGIVGGLVVAAMIASGGTLALIGTGLAAAGAFSGGLTIGQLITGEDLSGHKLSSEQKAEMGGELVGGVAGGALGGGAGAKIFRGPAAVPVDAPPVDDSIVVPEGAPAQKIPPSTSRVPLPNPGESDMDFGTRAHQELPRIIGETNPGADGQYNVAPGRTGPDLQNPTGMNATYAEMKSLWGRQAPMIRQNWNWGFDPQTARYFFYDRNTGMVWEGIIQTEKFPSGRFRP
jgi:hypothetical protein